MINVPIMMLHPDAITPEYKTNGAAGFDFHSIEDFEVTPWESILSGKTGRTIRTGIAFEIPEGYEIQNRGRSGLAFNNDILTHIGTIDSDYRGEVKVLIWNLGNESFFIKKGDRIAQGVLSVVEKANFVQANRLGQTERGVGGFGHTGR